MTAAVGRARQPTAAAVGVPGSERGLEETVVIADHEPSEPAAKAVRFLRHHVAYPQEGVAVRRRIDTKAENGVAMAEFALIAPVFLLLMIGIISFGRVVFVWIDANHLANETARWAAVDQNPYAPPGATPPGAGGRTLQQHVADNGFADSNICITHQDATPTVGERLTVRVHRPIRVRIGLPIVGELDVGFTVRGTSTMRIENLENPPAYSTGGNLGSCP